MNGVVSGCTLSWRVVLELLAGFALLLVSSSEVLISQKTKTKKQVAEGKRGGCKS